LPDASLWRISIPGEDTESGPRTVADACPASVGGDTADDVTV